jgi:hypothetical protein
VVWIELVTKGCSRMDWLDRALSLGAQQETVWVFTFCADLISSISIPFFKIYQAAEKVVFSRLLKKGQMQGSRNPEK